MFHFLLLQKWIPTLPFYSTYISDNSLMWSTFLPRYSSTSLSYGSGSTPDLRKVIFSISTSVSYLETKFDSEEGSFILNLSKANSWFRIRLLWLWNSKLQSWHTSRKITFEIAIFVFSNVVTTFPSKTITWLGKLLILTNVIINF